MKNTKSKFMIIGVLILIIFGVLIVAGAMGLIGREVIDKTIKEETIPDDVTSVKIMGTNNGIEIKTYDKNGTEKTEKFPTGNYIFKSKYFTISIDEYLEYEITNVSEDMQEDMGGIGESVSSSFSLFSGKFRNKMFILETSGYYAEMLENNDEFKKITKGKEWYVTGSGSSSGGGLFIGHYSYEKIWFVVDNKTLYKALIDGEADKIEYINKISDVGGMSREEIWHIQDKTERPNKPSITEKKENIIAIMENDDEFKRLVDGKNWEDTGWGGGGDSTSMNIIIDNKSYVIAVDMIGENVIAIKDVTDAIKEHEMKMQEYENESKNKTSRYPLIDREEEQKKWKEEENKVLQIALADEKVKEIIGGKRYTVTGHGSSGGPGYNFKTIDVHVGMIPIIFGTDYVIFVDYDEEKVLAVTEVK